ncbi:uncharacterized protein PHACADRAFT_252458 [Phanerochaete carnosa HHB-10118-sp]|uniref:SUN domain-containing protein n=1 Tax=Phanerochaete carnosa (strain HHB-10118-sp) TaxID=650164 RepID=K5V6D1_PHACS|nr:uncharacterized protein PHACADRAFT_252458 [Phanerochaete carnosa HHB-10118-sp]EKM58261.1 hypothetical protein PHACADRAFT_252458 [Phanerochaete carnosa HHB-10118-sp]
MSFASTPLGQGRRLDHNTFLGKGGPQIREAANGLRAHPLQRQIYHKPPASYAHGAPSQSTRSPPKPVSSATAPAPAYVEEKEQEEQENDPVSDSEQPALVRFARLKEREQEQQSNPNGRVLGPRVINTPPNPEYWTVKDTSVNIASAFHRAAGGTIIPAHDSSLRSNTSSSFNNSSLNMNTANNSWASGAQQKPNLPRSTSVEYEKETHSIVMNRRLGAPPGRGTRPARPPPSPSTRLMPSSDAEQEAPQPLQRGMSPFEHIVEATRRLAPATFLMRRQSEEPETRAPPTKGPQDKSSSYDYSAEEREFNSLSHDQPNGQRNAGHKRNRISVDNKAYLPTQSDLEDSDGDFEEDGKKTRKRRNAKKHGTTGGPLTSLPITSYDKRKKKRRGMKSNGMDDDESSEEEGQSNEQVKDQQSIPVLPSRHSIPPAEIGNNTSFFDAMNVEAGLERSLESILEEDETAADDSVEVLSQQTYGPGAILGRGVHLIFTTVSLITSAIWSIFAYTPLLIGRVLGSLFDLVVLQPAQWITGADLRPLIKLGKYATIALSLYVAWYALNSGLLELPSLPSPSPVYRPPSDIPPADISELSSRLIRIESALASLSVDTIRLREDARTHGSQLGALENQILRESNRVLEAESKFSSTTQGLQAIRQEVQMLHAELEAQKKQQGEHRSEHNTDEDARARLRELEARVGTVEGGVKEALELGKHSTPDSPSGNVISWWNKLASGKTSSLTIKSSDGKDVTGLISQLVDSAVSKMSKDTLARPDYALYSSGASIIPSLTSDTFEMKPQGLASSLLGMVTGNGYAVGRPPVTALHHETHNGHCWPFSGTQGQLGVMLATPVHITDVTIDHVAKEVATDMRSAPRHIELWGLVEGGENVAKYEVLEAQRATEREAARAAAELAGEEYVEPKDSYPETLPRSVPYMKIADFAYNIYAPHHVQTFAVPQEIQDLGIDFGVVVLMVKSNWGREDFTCLYRFRIHGERLGGMPEPLPDDAAAE